MLNTPVLLLIFNRSDTLEQLMPMLQKIQPRQLYIGADGPRKDKSGEKEKCEAARKTVLNGITWECEVKTLFREENLGCGHGPADAITWFFKYEEYGIILEDDILPSFSFFPFCEDLLHRYADNERIMSIGGTNLFSNKYSPITSYIFSKYAGNWGWASWRRAWKKFDFRIDEWRQPQIKSIIKQQLLPEQYKYLESIFDYLVENVKDDIWDYQWMFHRLRNQGFGITPKVNLTKNIGFDKDATHTFIVDQNIANLRNEELEFPLSHPAHIFINKEYDKILSRRYYWKELDNVFSKTKRFIRNIIK